MMMMLSHLTVKKPILVTRNSQLLNDPRQLMLILSQKGSCIRPIWSIRVPREMFSYITVSLPSKIIPVLHENISPGRGTGKRAWGRILLFRILQGIVQQSVSGFIGYVQ